MSFRKWALEQELLEIFDKSTFMNQNPEGGIWEPPLGQGNGHYKFYYSLPSDPQKTCGFDDKPCYYVNMNHGSISFAHYDTRYGDRWEKNLEIAKGNEDVAKNLSTEQINSILFAIGKYVEVDHPDQLSWSAVSKSRRDSNNPQARRKIYFMWSAKNLYPDYVPLDEENWIKFDKFMQQYGYIEGLTSEEEIRQLSAKKFLEMMEEIKEKKRQRDNEEWERREREEQERQRQAAATMLADPRHNPNNIQIGDIVINKEGPTASPTQNTRHGRLYKVDNIVPDRYGDYGRQGDLVAMISPHFEDGESQEFRHDPYYGRDAFWTPLKKLNKHNEQNLQTRSNVLQRHRDAEAESQRQKMERLASYLANPQINPNGVTLGDLVFVKATSPNGYASRRQGMYAKIKDIQIDQYGDFSRDYQTNQDGSGHYGLYATVEPVRDQDYDNRYTSDENISIKDLVKASPENRRIRQYNVAQRHVTGGRTGVDMPPADWQAEPRAGERPVPGDWPDVW